MAVVRALHTSSDFLLRWTYSILFIAPALMVGSLLTAFLPHPIDFFTRAVGMVSAFTLVLLVCCLRAAYARDANSVTPEGVTRVELGKVEAPDERKGYSAEHQ